MQPIAPTQLSPTGNAWPRPRLSQRNKIVLNLDLTQLLYATCAFLVWDWGRTAIRYNLQPLDWRTPWTYEQGAVVWAIVCLVLGAFVTYLRWHGLHAVEVVLRFYTIKTSPVLSIWRPVDIGYEEAAEDDVDEALREVARPAKGTAPVKDASNPMGWVVD